MTADQRTEPIWKRQPTTWKVADIHGPGLIATAVTGCAVKVTYSTGGRPTIGPLKVDVIAQLDGFLVNACGPNVRYSGVDVMPVADRGLGELVENRFHPVDPEWLDDIRPRLHAAIRRAAAVVAAHRDGAACRHEARVLNGQNEITRTCARPAGHGAEVDHSDGSCTWNDAGEVTGR